MSVHFLYICFCYIFNYFFLWDLFSVKIASVASAILPHLFKKQKLILLLLSEILFGCFFR